MKFTAIVYYDFYRGGSLEMHICATEVYSFARTVEVSRFVRRQLNRSPTRSKKAAGSLRPTPGCRDVIRMTASIPFATRLRFFFKFWFLVMQQVLYIL